MRKRQRKKIYKNSLIRVIDELPLTIELGRFHDVSKSGFAYYEFVSKEYPELRLSVWGGPQGFTIVGDHKLLVSKLKPGYTHFEADSIGDFLFSLVSYKLKYPIHKEYLELIEEVETRKAAIDKANKELLFRFLEKALSLETEDYYFRIKSSSYTLVDYSISLYMKEESEISEEDLSERMLEAYLDFSTLLEPSRHSYLGKDAYYFNYFDRFLITEEDWRGVNGNEEKAFEKFIKG